MGLIRQTQQEKNEIRVPACVSFIYGVQPRILLTPLTRDRRIPGIHLTQQRSQQRRCGRYARRRPRTHAMSDGTSDAPWRAKVSSADAAFPFVNVPGGRYGGRSESRSSNLGGGRAASVSPTKLLGSAKRLPPHSANRANSVSYTYPRRASPRLALMHDGSCFSDISKGAREVLFEVYGRPSGCVCPVRSRHCL